METIEINHIVENIGSASKKTTKASYKVKPKGSFRIKGNKPILSPFMIKKYVLQPELLSDIDIAIIQKSLKSDPVARRTYREFKKEYSRR